jgi:hypothetical protein
LGLRIQLSFAKQNQFLLVKSVSHPQHAEAQKKGRLQYKICDLKFLFFLYCNRTQGLSGAREVLYQSYISPAMTLDSSVGKELEGGPQPHRGITSQKVAEVLTDLPQQVTCWVGKIALC